VFPHHSEDHAAAVASSELADIKQQPYAYLQCGHVQGRHAWGLNKDSNSRTCPMCLKVNLKFKNICYSFKMLLNV